MFFERKITFTIIVPRLSLCLLIETCLTFKVRLGLGKVRLRL